MTSDGAHGPEVKRVLDRLTHDLPEALPGRLIGLYLYGPLVTGDCHPARSDFDLLA